MLYLKINHGKEIHLVTKQITFGELMTFIRENFKNLPKNFEIGYQDSDGDNISISNEEDLQTLYGTSKEKFAKIAVTEVKEEEDEEKIGITIPEKIPEIETMIIEEGKVEGEGNEGVSFRLAESDLIIGNRCDDATFDFPAENEVKV